MSFIYTLVGFLKKFAVIILILAVAIPLRYGSIDHHYLTLRLLHSALSLKHSIVPDQARSTLSADYRAFEDIFRMKPAAKHDPAADPMIAVNHFRFMFNMSTMIPKPSRCQINKEIFEHDGHSVITYWIEYPASELPKKSDKLLFFIHGGGFIAGDIHGYSGIECHLSRLFNVTVLHVEYRLSPEHPLPAAVEDTVAVYRALLRQNIPASQLLIIGDSAGGGLALLTVQSLIAHQLPVPRGVISLSPWVDLSISSDSYKRNAQTDLILNEDILKLFASQAFDPKRSELSLNNPPIDVLSGSFEGFPPIYINVGTSEVLQDDSRRVVDKAKEAGVNVTFEEGLHLMHVYPYLFPYFPEARNTLDNINKWIQSIFH